MIADIKMYGLLPEIWVIIASDLPSTSKLIRVSHQLNTLLINNLTSIINDPTDDDLLFIGVKKYYWYKITSLQSKTLTFPPRGCIQYYIMDDEYQLVRTTSPIDEPYHIRIINSHIGPIGISVLLPHGLTSTVIQQFEPTMTIDPKCVGNRYILVDNTLRNRLQCCFSSSLDGVDTSILYSETTNNRLLLMRYIGYFNKK